MIDFQNLDQTKNVKKLNALQKWYVVWKFIDDGSFPQPFALKCAESLGDDLDLMLKILSGGRECDIDNSIIKRIPR